MIFRLCPRGFQNEIIIVEDNNLSDADQEVLISVGFEEINEEEYKKEKAYFNKIKHQPGEYVFSVMNMDTYYFAAQQSKLMKKWN